MEVVDVVFALRFRHRTWDTLELDDFSCLPSVSVLHANNAVAGGGSGGNASVANVTMTCIVSAVRHRQCSVGFHQE